MTSPGASWWHIFCIIFADRRLQIQFLRVDKMLGAKVTVKIIRKFCSFRKRVSKFWCPWTFNAKQCSSKQTAGWHTLAAIPPMRTDLMKIPQSRRLRNTFVTLMPRLAKPDSPRAMWKVSRSRSSWAELWSTLVSDAAVVVSDEMLLTGLLLLVSALLSDASLAVDTVAIAADATLAGCYSNMHTTGTMTMSAIHWHKPH